MTERQRDREIEIQRGRDRYKVAGSQESNISSKTRYLKRQRATERQKYKERDRKTKRDRSKFMLKSITVQS